MTNTATQTETGKRNRHPARDDNEPTVPTVINILNEGPDEGDLTAAEIITNKDMDPEDKRRELLRQWGRKGGLKSAKSTTKWKPEFVDIAKKLAIIGVAEADMAALFQVRTATFRGWKRAHPPLRLALKEGESLKRTVLLQQIQDTAQAGIFQMQIFLAKNWLGMTDRQDIRSKHEETIIYKSHIPQEQGSPDVDPGSIKRSTKKLQDRPQGKQGKK